MGGLVFGGRVMVGLLWKERVIKLRRHLIVAQPFGLKSCYVLVEVEKWASRAWKSCEWVGGRGVLSYLIRVAALLAAVHPPLCDMNTYAWCSSLAVPHLQFAAALPLPYALLPYLTISVVDALLNHPYGSLTRPHACRHKPFRRLLLHSPLTFGGLVRPMHVFSEILGRRLRGPGSGRPWNLNIFCC